MSCSCYALAFDYNGYWGLAILTLTMWMLAVATYLWLEYEILAVAATPDTQRPTPNT